MKNYIICQLCKPFKFNTDLILCFTLSKFGYHCFRVGPFDRLRLSSLRLLLSSLLFKLTSYLLLKL